MPDVDYDQAVEGEEEEEGGGVRCGLWEAHGLMQCRESSELAEVVMYGMGTLYLYECTRQKFTKANGRNQYETEDRGAEQSFIFASQAFPALARFKL